MIKLIASDLDGTWFRDDKSYNEEIFDVYEKMKENGIIYLWKWNKDSFLWSSIV